MALRNLVAACCRSGAGTPAAAAVPSPRFLATVRNQVKQHSNGARKETLDEKAFRNKGLDKVSETLRQREKDCEKLIGEMKRVLKIFGVSWVGIAAYSRFRSWRLEKSTQPAAQGTSHE